MKFNSHWNFMENCKPHSIHVDPSKPSLVDPSCRVLSVPKLLRMTSNIDLNFEGYDDDFACAEDAERFAACDPAADICDLFEEQEAIKAAKIQAANRAASNSQNSAAGGAPQQQSQAAHNQDDLGNKSPE